MASTLERRNEHPERVPLRMAVELGHGDFRDPFAASVCNVSKGGISMRATCLPDVGSRLMCRFRCMPSNTLVTVQGEIVWAHLDGENCGEFGLSFVDLDPKSEWLIEEMIAEHATLTRDSEAAAPIATLELEGSPASIEARLSHQSGGHAVFEQQLALLSLGRGVRAHTDGHDLLAGSIASVALKMVGAVPMLTVTVAFEHGAEVELGGQFELPVHDTEPDLTAPEQVAAQHAEDEPQAQPIAACDDFGQDPEIDDAGLRAPCEQVLPSQSAHANAQRAASNSVQFKTARTSADDEDDAAFAAELDAVRTPQWKPVVVAVARRCQASALALHAAFRPMLVAATRAALPIVRGNALRAASRTRAVYRAQIAPQLGTLRRVLASQLSGRRRRVTAGPSSSAQHARVAPLGRTLLLGVLAAGAVGLAVYALAPNAVDDSIAPHRKAREKVAAREAAESAADNQALPKAPVAGPIPVDMTFAAGSPAAAAPASTKPVAGPAPAAAADPKPAPRKLRFGATRVPGGRQFALRMSAPIQSLDGAADRGGFTVIIHGCLSLDRAGPIGSAHKSVSRAMVINKGDHAELSVRFSDGKQPAYKVNADGSTLYITIADA